jgi:hypothetical protein
MDAPSVNQAFVCELSHLSVPQWPIFLACVIFGMVMGHGTIGAEAISSTPSGIFPFAMIFMIIEELRGTTSIATPWVQKGFWLGLPLSC